MSKVNQTKYLNTCHCENVVSDKIDNQIYCRNKTAWPEPARTGLATSPDMIGTDSSLSPIGGLPLFATDQCGRHSVPLMVD